MKKFILSILLVGTFLFSTNATNADDSFTKFADVAINDTVESAVLVCENKLNYAVHVGQIQPGVFAMMICEPGIEETDKTYPTITRGKPIEMSLLVFEGKIVGIHLLYANRLAYKKTLANFVSSGIMKEGIEKVSPLISPQQTYKNYRENWLGWYYSFDAVTEPKTTLYVIHVESLKSNDSIDQQPTK